MAHVASSNLVLLSLGSNIGNREENLREAVRRLSLSLENVKMSSIYESEPMYVLEQPLFLNAVISGYIRLSARRLLELTQAIEQEMGRDIATRSGKGPRTIDIDILLFDNLILEEPDLAIPHPGIKERKFVLVPLLELSPGITEPGSGNKYSEFLARVGDQNVVLYKKL